MGGENKEKMIKMREITTSHFDLRTNFRLRNTNGVRAEG